MFYGFVLYLSFFVEGANRKYLWISMSVSSSALWSNQPTEMTHIEYVSNIKENDGHKRTADLHAVMSFVPLLCSLLLSYAFRSTPDGRVSLCVIV